MEGVDGIFIGPADLSAALGFIEDRNHPTVIATIKAMLQVTVTTTAQPPLFHNSAHMAKLAGGACYFSCSSSRRMRDGHLID